MVWSYDIPVVGSTTDPEWATEIANALQLIKDHLHLGTSDDAGKITVAALDINSDLPFSGNNLITLRSAIFQNLSSDPAGIQDICSLYFKNGNFFINNQAGAHVQVTNGTGLNISTGVANLYPSTIITTNTSILNTDTFIYIEVNTTSARSLFLPGANTVSAGRFYYIKDISGLSEANAISLVPNGTDKIDTVNANYSLKTNFGSWLLFCDGSSNWYVSQFSNASHNAGSFDSTGTNMVLNSKSNYLVLESNLANVTLAPNGTISLTSDGAAGIYLTSGSVGLQVSGFSDFNGVTNFHDTVNVKSTILNVDGYSDIVNAGNTILQATGNLYSDGPSFFNGLITVNANMNFQFGTTITGTPIFDTTTHFNEPVIFEDNMNINNSLITINGGCTVNLSAGSTLGVHGTANFYNGLSILTGGLSVAGATLLSSTLDANGSYVNIAGTFTTQSTNTYAGASTFNGVTNHNALAKFPVGASLPWRQLAVPNVTTYSFAAHDYEYVSMGTLSSTLDLTIDDTNAVNGDHHVIENFSTQSVNVKIPGGSTLLTLTSGFGTPTYVYMIRRAGVWTFINKG